MDRIQEVEFQMSEADIPPPTAEPEITPSPGLLSPVMTALDQRPIRLHQPDGCGHLLTAYAILHRRTERAIRLAVDAIEKEEERRHKEGLEQSTSGNPLAALDAFLDAVYRAAELYEFYENDIPRYLRLNRKPEQNYKKEIAPVKRPWALVCNKCKHEHAFLVPVEGMYDGGAWLTGFSLYEWKGAYLQVNKDFHSDGGACSYNWAVRALIGDILRADRIASKIIDALPQVDGLSPITSYGIYLPYFPLISRISRRSLLSMPGGEDGFAARSVGVQDGQLVMDGELKAERGSGPFLMRVIYDLPGNDTPIHYRGPYGIFENRDAQIQQEEGSARLPFPGYLRFCHEVTIPPRPENLSPYSC